MKQLTYIKKNTLEWHEVPDPVLKGPTDVIVRPLAVGRCDGDKVFLYHNITRPLKLGMAVHYIDPVTAKMLGDNPYKGPIAVGHEATAEVIRCGEDVKSLKVGDRVIVPWSISCGHCRTCTSGYTSSCEHAGETHMNAFGFGEAMGPWGGMVCDQFRVPYADHMLVKIPKELDPPVMAVAGDNLTDGWRTVAPHLNSKPGSPVLVVGGAAESIGLYAAGIAVALGSTQVDYVDYSQQRLEIAQKLGANPIQIPAKYERKKWFKANSPIIRGKYPISVDCSARADGTRFAIRSLDIGGICTNVAYNFKTNTSLPLTQMYFNSATFHMGLTHPHGHLQDVLDLVISGKFKPELVTTLKADFADGTEAYLAKTTKVVLTQKSIF